MTTISPSRIVAILEWYYETRRNPSMPSCLAGMPAATCTQCGAEVGELHRGECSQAGRVNTGCARPRASSPDPEPVALRRLAAIGAALARLTNNQEDTVRSAFVSRRWAIDAQARVTNFAVKRGRWLNHRLREHSNAQARKAELKAIAAEHWRQWRNITRRRVYRDALTRLMSEATRGAIW